MAKARVRSSSGLNLREKPNGRVVDVLHADEEVTVLDKVSFYRVETTDGHHGYVHGDFLEVFPDEATPLLEAASAEVVFPSASFELVEFSGQNFVGEKVLIDKDFGAALKRVDEYAGRCQLNVWVTSSVRNLNEQVRGAIVPPASNSCHHVGHAIDMNLQYEGRLYNSKKLKKSNFSQLPKTLQNFLTMIRDDAELRWGGDFSKEDPVHIDDNLFRLRETAYLAKLHSRVDQLNAS